jgi:uncharacterized damage-inducible protein DinB
MAKQMYAADLSNRDFLIRRWTQEHPAFVDVFKALPATQLDYRPHPESRSAGELVALLVSVQQGCIELCESGQGSFKRLRWHTPNGLFTLGEMISASEEHHRILAGHLLKLDETSWHRQAWLTIGDQEIILKDTVGGLLWLALFDSVHHRGQLSTYIRPMGGKVPSIYGPSSDAPAR